MLLLYVLLGNGRRRYGGGLWLQERWQCTGTSVMCTASLVDAYAAMANTAEEHVALAAVHPLYAAMLEKMLVEVAHQHITKLEQLAQVQQAKRLSLKCTSVILSSLQACQYLHGL